LLHIAKDKLAVKDGKSNQNHCFSHSLQQNAAYFRIAISSKPLRHFPDCLQEAATKPATTTHSGT
jgi:hypothetical protein